MKGYGTILATFVVGVVVGAVGMLLVHPTGDLGTEVGLRPLRSGATEAVNATTERYTNKDYGLSLSYPAELTVQEFPQSGALTIVFQHPSEEKGFQIFIVPYPEAQISQARIKTDLAGGPMDNPVEIVLAGNIPAVHFESRAPIIGESTEVWFIHAGHLYEVTTYRAHDAWLASILGTLQFTN